MAAVPGVTQVLSCRAANSIDRGCVVFHEAVPRPSSLSLIKQKRGARLYQEEVISSDPRHAALCPTPAARQSAFCIVTAPAKACACIDATK